MPRWMEDVEGRMKLDEFLFYGGGALLIETLNVFAELFLKTRMIRFSRDWRACPTTDCFLCADRLNRP